MNKQTQAYHEERRDLRAQNIRHTERERELLERIRRMESSQPAEMPGNDRLHVQIHTLQQELHALTQKEQH